MEIRIITGVTLAVGRVGVEPAADDVAVIVEFSRNEITVAGCRAESYAFLTNGDKAVADEIREYGDQETIGRDVQPNGMVVEQTRSIAVEHLKNCVAHSEQPVGRVVKLSEYVTNGQRPGNKGSAAVCALCCRL